MSNIREGYFEEAISIAKKINELSKKYPTLDHNKQQIIAQSSYLIGFLEGGLEMEKYDKTTE